MSKLRMSHNPEVDPKNCIHNEIRRDDDWGDNPGEQEWECILCGLRFYPATYIVKTVPLVRMEKRQ